MCVQPPGTVAYVPHNWWHATLNLGPFQLAIGSKMATDWPSLHIDVPGFAVAEVKAPFAEASEIDSYNWQTVDFTAANKRATLAVTSPGQDHEPPAAAERAITALQGPLLWLVNKVASVDGARAGTADEVNAMSKAAAYAICMVAERFRQLGSRARHGALHTQPRQKVSDGLLDLAADYWREVGACIDPEICTRQCPWVKPNASASQLSTVACNSARRGRVPVGAAARSYAMCRNWKASQHRVCSVPLA
eukprot:2619491-Prymnesium_polylepis.1